MGGLDTNDLEFTLYKDLKWSYHNKYMIKFSQHTIQINQEMRFALIWQELRIITFSLLEAKSSKFHNTSERTTNWA